MATILGDPAEPAVRPPSRRRPVLALTAGVVGILVAAGLWVGVFSQRHPEVSFGYSSAYDGFRPPDGPPGPVEQFVMTKDEGSFARTVRNDGSYPVTLARADDGATRYLRGVAFFPVGDGDFSMPAGPGASSIEVRPGQEVLARWDFAVDVCAEDTEASFVHGPSLRVVTRNADLLQTFPVSLQVTPSQLPRPGGC